MKRNIGLDIIIAQKIRAKRIEKKMSQDDVSYAVGKSRVAIVNIEGATQEVTVDLLFKLAHLFACGFNELLPTEKELTPELRSRDASKIWNKKNKIERLEKQLELLKKEVEK